MSRNPFPHERLDAWKVADEARQIGLAFTATLPPGFGHEVRQINNATASVVRNVCEGAGRWQPADKIHRFEIASGEASEAAGAVHSLVSAGRGDAVVGRALLEHLGRAGACIGGLIRAQRRRQAG